MENIIVICKAQETCYRVTKARENTIPVTKLSTEKQDTGYKSARENMVPGNKSARKHGTGLQKRAKTWYRVTLKHGKTCIICKSRK